MIQSSMHMFCGRDAVASLQRSRATSSHDPATASFKNDQTLNLNSTPFPPNIKLKKSISINRSI